MPSAGGTALISLNVEAPGRYRLWSRVMAATSRANYYWLQVDKGCPVKVQSAVPGAWQWVNHFGGNAANVVDVTLSAGDIDLVLTGTQPDAMTFDVSAGRVTATVPEGEYDITSEVSAGDFDNSLGSTPGARSTVEVGVTAGQVELRAG